MNIINFDKYLSGDNKQIKHHYLLPDCHYMIVGSTGSGKTNLLLNMVLKWMNYDLCCDYTVNPEQDKYRFLKEQGIEVVVVVVAHIYPPATGQRQTLTYWTIRTLFITRTVS